MNSIKITTEDIKNYINQQQNFWSRPSRSYNPQPREIKVGDRVYKKGEHQLMFVTFIGQGVAICKWFDMNGYEIADTFDINDLELSNQADASTLEEDSHDCEESKKKGWCGEYCEQARKRKCPEGVKAKFPYEMEEDMSDYTPFMKEEE